MSISNDEVSYRLCKRCGYTENPDGWQVCVSCGTTKSLDEVTYDLGIDNLEKEVEDLKTELEKKKQGFNLLLKKIEQLERDNHRYYESSNQLEVRYEDLEKQLYQVREDFDNSNQRLSELYLENVQLVEANKKYRDLVIYCDNIENEKSSLFKKIDNLGKQNILLRNFKIGFVSFTILFLTSFSLLIYTNFSVLQNLRESRMYWRSNTFKWVRKFEKQYEDLQIETQTSQNIKLELDKAIGERDTAIGERDTAIGERDTARRARDTAIGERDTARRARDTARREAQKFSLFENNSVKYEGYLSSNNTDDNAIFYSFYVPEKATFSITVEASTNLSPRFGIIVGNNYSSIYCQSSESVSDCNISDLGLHQIKLWNNSDQSGSFTLTIRKKDELILEN